MKHRTHIKSTPTHIKMLLTRMGDKKASSALGVTPSALHKYIRSGKAPLATEIAAQSLCTSNLNKPATAIITGDDGLLETIKRIVELGSGGFQQIK